MEECKYVPCFLDNGSRFREYALAIHQTEATLPAIKHWSSVLSLVHTNLMTIQVVSIAYQLSN